MEHSVRDYIIDVHTASINELLDQSGKIRSGRAWGVFRVPPSQLDVQKGSFLPKTISIGPFHYVSPDTMYPLKLRHLHRLLGGKVGETDESRNVVLLKDLVRAMVDLEQSTREYYSETFDISSDEFVKMMVVDGCFVVELLRLHFEHFEFCQGELPFGDYDSEPRDSPVFTMRGLLPSLRRDLMKLENQLPYFVLEKLFKLTASEKEQSLRNLCAAFFYPMLLQNHTLLPRGIDYDHLVDFVRALIVSVMNRGPRQNRGNPKLIYSAQNLRKAGVTFFKQEHSHLLDIEYDMGVLRIPPLSIDESMITVLLNIVAYEQCTQGVPPFFTNYFLFLRSLINTTEDAKILAKSEIIKYPLGSEKEVVDLFNDFCKEMQYSFDQYYLSVNMNDVNNYCKTYYENKWRIWYSNLNKERFSVAAIFLSILTLLQTIYTMFSYYRQY